MPHSPLASPPAPGTVFVRRLGPHHFAHLRACAEGLDLIESARRFLGVEHGHQAKTAHRQTVEAVRAIARRRGHSAWRLIGLAIRPQTAQAGAPTLEEFAAQQQLDGWSEAEVAQMHAEAWPADPKAARRQRLRERQLDLLRGLQALACEIPLASDAVAGWFDDATAARLVTAGMATLGQLQESILRGGRWWAALPAIGPAKAERIAAHLATLLPPGQALKRPHFRLAGSTSSPQQALAALDAEACPALLNLPDESPASPDELSADLPALPPASQQGLAAQPGVMLAARSDFEAVQAWIDARAGSLATAKVYQREATRLLLWLQHEAGGKSLREMRTADCSAFMAFLQHIPPAWISRVRASPGEEGWAPFRGPLSHQSQKQAVTIVASLYTWLQAAQYLSANPWVLVNQKTGDDRERRMLDTKALSEAASADILAFIEAQPPTPSRARIAFIVRFVQAVGLRSAELLGARLGDFQCEPEGWVLQVHGKGARNRIAAVPPQALAALQEYLAARGLGAIESAPSTAPLLAATHDPLAPIGYQALYEHVKGWLAKAVRLSSLPERERDKLAGATTHWLRHTFGTRAIAREVPLDVIQAQMGHASIQTTTAIYGRAPIRRRAEELGKAFN